MKDDFGLFNMRFIIPPVIATIAALMLWKPEIIDNLPGFFKNLNSEVSILSTIGAYAVIYALGFVISSIAHLIITLLKWDATNFETIGSNNIQERNIKEAYVWAHLLMRGQIILDTKSKEYVEEKLARRLNMSAINFNSAIGIIIVLLSYVVCLLTKHADFSPYVIVIIVILIFIFLYNAINVRKSHHLLKRILMIISKEDIMNNYKEFKKKIIEKLEKQNLNN
ncbi:MAG: hypothetical protein V1765_01630 [bacterium]